MITNYNGNSEGLAEEQTSYWKNLKVSKIDEYWFANKPIARSKWFCEQIESLDFNSIFECGVLSGRNLFYIKNSFPNVIVSGLEINTTAIQYAKNKLPNIDIFETNLYDISKINSKYDIVFTSGVLIHVIPKDINKIISNIIGLASKYVIHIEDIGPGTLMVGPKEASPALGIGTQWQWSVDLIDKYTELGFDPTVIDLPDDLKTTGASSMTIVKIL